MTISINTGGTAGDAGSTPHTEDARIGALPVTSVAERLRCLPDVAGPRFIALEHTVYDRLAMLSPDYQGGFWHYYRLSNGGFYRSPPRWPTAICPFWPTASDSAGRTTCCRASLPSMPKRGLSTPRSTENSPRPARRHAHAVLSEPIKELP